LRRLLKPGTSDQAKITEADRGRLHAGALPPLEHPLPEDPRARDLRVTPHALGRYDGLAAAKTEGDHE
jgi:hypothetical protein